MSDRLAIMKRRLAIMAAINLVCGVVAVVAAVAAFGRDTQGAVWVFVGALLAGFAAQAWFILGIRLPNEGD